jgi:hypothetical protein
MLTRLSIAAVSIISLVFIVGTNAHAAHTPRITSPRVTFGGSNDLQDAFSTFFMRDPSDGGEGTSVVASFGSSSDAEDWRLIKDTGRCPGATVSSICPGGWISANFSGSTIVVIKNVGQGTLCVRTAADTNYTAKMGPCDTGPIGTGGNNEISSAFILGGPPGFEFDSVVASDAFMQDEWLTSTGTTNDATVFDQPGGFTNAGIWTPASS